MPWGFNYPELSLIFLKWLYVIRECAEWDFPEEAWIKKSQHIFCLPEIIVYEWEILLIEEYPDIRESGFQLSKSEYVVEVSMRKDYIFRIQVFLPEKCNGSCHRIRCIDDCASISFIGYIAGC